MTIPVWIRANAWREIFTRIFEDWQIQVNVYPAWLINPETGRRLKLDMLCPEFDLAVRFEGVQRKGQTRSRPSLEEEEQEQIRQKARVDICEQHGVSLLVIDVTADNVKTLLQEVDITLSQIKRNVTEPTLQDKINQARTTASTLTRHLKTARNLKIYADLWEDRQYQLAKPKATSEPAAPALELTAGMDVEHAVFGLGTVVSTEPSGHDTVITVDFLEVGRKTLAASLVADKLKVL